MERDTAMQGLLDRLTGRLLYWLVRLGVAPARWPWGSCGTVILEVKGRRSGQLRSTLVTWAEYADERYLVVMPAEEPQWVRNMRADGGHVTLCHGGRRTPVVLREVPRGQRAAILQVWYRTTGVSSHPRRHFGVDRCASIEDFERLAASHAVFRCDPHVGATRTPSESPPE
jgi:deazaflavin-dependent oxidoreductase (nitroreductase family)